MSLLEAAQKCKESCEPILCVRLIAPPCCPFDFLLAGTEFNLTEAGRRRETGAVARHVRTPSPALLKKTGAEDAVLPTIPAFLLGFFSQDVGFTWKEMGMTFGGSGVTAVIRGWSGGPRGSLRPSGSPFCPPPQYRWFFPL